MLDFNYWSILLKESLKEINLEISIRNSINLKFIFKINLKRIEVFPNFKEIISEYFEIQVHGIIDIEKIDIVKDEIFQRKEYYFKFILLLFV